MTYAQTQLGNVAEIIRGITFKPDDLIPVLESGAVVCFRTKNVQTQLDESDLIAVPSSFVKREDQFVHEHDILVSSANSWNLVGKCSYVPRLEYTATAGGFISILRARDGAINSRYLYHWFSSPNTQSLLRSFGRKTTNISNLNIPLTLKASIPLPPLEEQRRIAEVLDKADALRQKRRLALQKLDTLLQSVFLEMFGDPETNSLNLEKVRLGEYVQLQGGFAFKSKDYTPNGIRLVKISNVHFESIIWEDVDFLPETYLCKFSEFALKSGDIVLALTRPIIKSLNSVKIAQINASDLPCVLNQRVGRFVIKDHSRINSLFLIHLCYSQFFKKAVRRFSSESLQPNVSPKQVEQLVVPLPPINEQKRFAGIAMEIGNAKKRLKLSTEQSETLFNSIQNRAFTGGLFT